MMMVVVLYLDLDRLLWLLHFLLLSLHLLLLLLVRRLVLGLDPQELHLVLQQLADELHLDRIGGRS